MNHVKRVKDIKYADHKTHRHSLHGRHMQCFDCQVWGIALDVVSQKKPYNNDAGYIASLRSGKNKGWVVIHEAAKQGLDNSDGKYAISCMTHKTVVNTTSLPKARQIMKCPDFCEQCMRVKA